VKNLIRLILSTVSVSGTGLGHLGRWDSDLGLKNRENFPTPFSPSSDIMPGTLYRDAHGR
jgi:hypothetical protein